MPKKYIKKVQLPGESDDLYVKDAEAVASINGYVVDTATGKVVYDTTAATKVEVLFANTPISDSEIDSAIGNTNSNS